MLAAYYHFSYYHFYFLKFLAEFPAHTRCLINANVFQLFFIFPQFLENPSSTSSQISAYVLHFVNIDFETGRETFIILNCNKIITMLLNIQIEIKFHCIMQRQLLICAGSQTQEK